MTDKVVETLSLWDRCLNYLRDEIPAQKFNTWLQPLHAELKDHTLTLLAPNQFILDWVNEHFLVKIMETLRELSEDDPPVVRLRIGTKSRKEDEDGGDGGGASGLRLTKLLNSASQKTYAPHRSNLNQTFRFDNFVEGKSNQLARAAAQQVAENPGQAYNPLFIYGGVGLGKTHLTQAMGNYILEKNPGAKVLYLHSERFVADMIKALQHNAMNEFKRYYRSVNCLLIDDIQFFLKKKKNNKKNIFSILLFLYNK